MGVPLLCTQSGGGSFLTDGDVPEPGEGEAMAFLFLTSQGQGVCLESGAQSVLVYSVLRGKGR